MSRQTMIELLIELVSWATPSWYPLMTCLGCHFLWPSSVNQPHHFYMDPPPEKYSRKKISLVPSGEAKRSLPQPTIKLLTWGECMGYQQWFVAPHSTSSWSRSDRGQCFVGLVCSVLSCYMTLKGWALMGMRFLTLWWWYSPTFLRSPSRLGLFWGKFSPRHRFYQVKTRIKEHGDRACLYRVLCLGLVLISKTPSTVDFTFSLAMCWDL